MWSRITQWWYSAKPVTTAVVPDPEVGLLEREESDDALETLETTIVDQPAVDSSDMDALGRFLMDLKEDMKRDAEELKWWKEQKIEILKVNGRYESAPSSSGSEMAANLKSKLQQIKDRIKISLEPAEMALNDLLEDARPHVENLHKVMIRLGKELNAHAVNADERAAIHEIEVKICDVSIKMLDEMVALNDVIIDEVNYCLDSEKQGEKFAKMFAQFLVTLLTNMPSPELDFDFSQRYRANLESRIKGNREKIDIFETHIEGALKKAKAIVLKKNEDLRQAPVRVGDSVLGLFAKEKKVQAVEVTEDQSLTLKSANT